jgi:hypothetical protein
MREVRGENRWFGSLFFSFIAWSSTIHDLLIAKDH